VEPAVLMFKVGPSGTIMVCRQVVALGRPHAGQIVTVHVTDITLATEVDGQDIRTVRRTTSIPIRNVKGQRPRNAGGVSHVS
jgi:hypothetical protein